METFIYSLIASLVAGTAFLSYRHPKTGAKLATIGYAMCISVFLLVSAFRAGYEYGTLQYFKIDHNNEALDKTVTQIKSQTNYIYVITAITGLCFGSLYILSLTVFKTINDEKNNKPDYKSPKKIN